MLRGCGALRDRFALLTPYLRSYSFFKSNAEHAKKLWLKTRIVALSCRNSSNHTMVVRQSKFINEKFYDELHPITRFISRNMMWSPQQVYENNLAYLKRSMDSKELVVEEKWFQESELAHRDYRGWQFIPVNPAGVLRAHKEELLNEEMGSWISR
ncbi:hypothetical protein TSMEX_004065 [Taenia solium]|eukprot:TsM_000260600 transcript=TsM_000260600 gene=TsM_000260600